MTNQDQATKSIENFSSYRAVLFCVIGLFGCITPIYMATFPLMLKELQPEFGDLRTGLTVGYSLMVASLAIGGPLSGRLVDKFGHRRVLAIGIPLLALSVASFSIVPASLPYYILFSVVIGFIGSLTYLFVWLSWLPYWFDKRLGLALALAGSGVSLGLAIMPIFVEWLLRTLPWRDVYLVLAATVLVIGIPNLLTMKTPPTARKKNTSSDGQAEQLEGWELSEVFRSKCFWQLAFSYLLLCMLVNGNIIHLVPMLTDRGVDTSSAARAMSVLGMASIAGRLGSGLLLIRSQMNASHLGGAIFMLGVLGATILLKAESGVTILVAVAMIGLALGVEGELLNFMAKKLFGMRAHTTIAGALSTAFLIGILIGPLALSIGFDLTGSYLTVQYALVVAGVLASLLHFFVPYPKQTPAR